MLRTLLLARWRHDVNFVRTHFNGRTLLMFGAIAAWFVYQVYRSPSDVGFGLAGIDGARWGWRILLGSPLIYFVLLAMARRDSRSSSGIALLRTLPIPGSVVSRWLTLRHGTRTGVLALSLALPALGDRRVGPFVALAIVLGIVVLDLLAHLQARATRPAKARKDSLGLRVPIRGGVVSALVRRDCGFLLGSARSVVITLFLAIVTESVVVMRVPNVRDALIAAAVLQAIHAALQISLLERLFIRDGGLAPMLRALPIGGSNLLRARALLAGGLLALPGFLPAVLALIRGASPVGLAAFFAGTVIALPLCGALLYADVHVALFPRTQVASLLLAAALVAIVLFWFFVPFVTPVILAALLVVWGRGAAASFDRMEAG